jgi:hypothetical protein
MSSLITKRENINKNISYITMIDTSIEDKSFNETYTKEINAKVPVTDGNNPLINTYDDSIKLKGAPEISNEVSKKRTDIPKKRTSTKKTMENSKQKSDKIEVERADTTKELQMCRRELRLKSREI